MKQKIPVEEIAKEFAKFILQWCAPNEIIEYRKKFNIEKDLEGIFEQELFYLFMFLMTYVCQRVFTENKEFTENLLDAFHKYVYEKKLDLPKQVLDLIKLEHQIKDRYAQDYELAKKGPEFLKQLPYDFLGNISGKKIEDLATIEEIKKEFTERWGKTILEIQLWIGYLLKDTIDFMTKIKQKYEIGI